jgi:hypothetical protein
MAALTRNAVARLSCRGLSKATCSRDRPGEFDRNGLDGAQDVVEYWAIDWSKNGKFHQPTHLAGTGLGLPAP